MVSFVGKVGMGSHKHGISGTPGKSPKFRANQQIELKKTEQKEREQKAKRSPKYYSSIAEAIRENKPK